MFHAENAKADRFHMVFLQNIEQKQIAEQQLLRAKTEVKIAEQEALKFETLNRGLNNRVLYKLFLDKWDGTTKVVPGINGGTPPVIVGN